MSSMTEAGTDALLARPLPARSLIASLLLRTRPPRMRGSRLVQWCGLFGVAEGTARVALSRMVERGELRSNEGVYELAGRVQSRRGAQDWSLAPVLADWHGTWRIAMVAPGARDATDRTALRDSMRQVRCAELREGVWARPDNLPRESAPPESWRVVDAQCAWWSGRPDADDAALAAALFDARPVVAPGPVPRATPHALYGRARRGGRERAGRRLRGRCGRGRAHPVGPDVAGRARGRRALGCGASPCLLHLRGCVLGGVARLVLAAMSVRVRS